MESEGDETGKEDNGREKIGIVALSDCHLEGTVIENDRVADLPSSEFIFKVQEKSQDL